MTRSRDAANLLLDRYTVFRSLDENPSTKLELLPQVEFSRSTLDRVMRDLETAGLVVYTGGRWHLTVYGRCAFALHQRYRDQLEGLREAASLVDMPSEDTPFDCSLLIDADVHFSAGTIQGDVMQVLLDAARDATRFRLFTPRVLAPYVESFYENALVGDDSSVELVVPVSLFGELRTHFPHLIHEAVTDSPISFYTAEVPDSFGLWIADHDHVGVLVFGEDGVRGILVNDSDAALRWAEEQYEQLKQNADPVFFRGHPQKTA